MIFPITKNLVRSIVYRFLTEFGFLLRKHWNSMHYACLLSSLHSVIKALKKLLLRKLPFSFNEFRSLKSHLSKMLLCRKKRRKYSVIRFLPFVLWWNINFQNIFKIVIFRRAEQRMLFNQINKLLNLNVRCKFFSNTDNAWIPNHDWHFYSSNLF